MAVSVDLAKLDVQIRTSDVATGITRLDAFASSADGAEHSVKRLSTASGGLEQSLGRLKSALATVGLGLSFGGALKSAADFQTSINNLGKVSDRPLAEMQTQLKSVSSSLGSYAQLAQGYYQILSAGVTDATASMDMLTASSMAAKAAQVTQADTIRALTSLMTGFTGQLKDAADASDFLFSVERYGKTSVQELVPVVGDLASTARIAKIAAADMGAAFSVITQTAGSTPVAATQARSLFMNIANPSETMQKTLAGMGTNSTEFFSSNRLLDALKKLDTEARKTGKTIGALFTDREAKVAAENLISSSKSFEESLAGIERRAGATSSAFGKYTASINGQIDEMSNNMSNLATNIGTTFGGTATQALTSFNSVLSEINANFTTFVPVLTTVGAGMAALVVARKASNTTFAVGDDGQRVTGLRAYIAAQYENVAATREQQAAEAKLAMVRVQDEMAEYKSSASRAVNQAILNRSTMARMAYEQGLRDLQTDLTAKTVAYEASLKTLGRTSVTAGTAMKGLKSAGSSLLGVFGGPWGAAFTVAVMGVAGLTSAMAERTALHEKYRQSLDDIGTAADEMSGKLTRAAQSTLTSKLNQAKAELERTKQDIDRLKEELKGMDLGYGEWSGSYRILSSASEKFFGANPGTWEAAKVLDSYSKGLTDAYQAQKQLLELQAQFGRTEAIVEASTRIDELANATRKAVKEEESVATLNQRLNETGDAGNAAASGINAAGDAAAGAMGKLAGLADVLQDSNFTAYTAGLTGAQKTFATAMKGKLNEKQLAAYFSGKTGDLSATDSRTLQSNKAELNAIYANYKKMYSLQEATKHAGSAASAKEAIQRVREEIERLNEVQPTSAAKLAQALRDIAKEGKQAGMSATAVSALQAEYKAAFDDSQARKMTEALRDFDREIASLTGDARTMRELEMTGTLEQWKKKLLEAGVSAEEAAPKLARMKDALERSNRTKDIQTTVQFYKELAELSGDLTYCLQAQNELIALQAEQYRNNGIAPDLVAQWEALKRLQASNSGWDGAARSMMSYYSEAANAGKNFETFFTNSFSSLEDTLVQFTQTGKLSFADMVNSMLADLARLAIRQSITGPIAQGLGSLFSGFGGGSSYTGYSGMALGMTGFIPGFATGGVAAPSGLPRSGGLLTSPIFFNDGMSRAYASGGLSVAGEAGPEVFMPAARMSDGNYGVRVDMSAVSAQLRAGLSGTTAPNISINVINQTGGQVEAETQARPDGQGGFTLDILLTQVEQGLVARAKSGRSSLMQYQEKAYGLSRASVLTRGRGRA